jgi:uncharacterized membrane protein YcjF (UPF0283 family)
MNIPPKLLTWTVIPVGLLWLVSAAVHGFHYHAGALESVPSFWLAMFYVGGPIVLFIAAMLITIRRRERSSFERIDRVALLVAGLGAVVFAGTLAVMLLELRRLNHELPNHPLSPDSQVQQVSPAESL